MKTRNETAAARAAALFVVLMTAKLLVCLLRSVDGSAFHAARLLTIGREEALVAFAFAAVALALARHQRASSALYALVAAYAAINVPVTRIVASPLTASMREATGGTIADSLGRYVTVSNVVAILALVATAVLAPRIVARAGRKTTFGIAAFAGVVAIVGYLAPPPTLALHRDPVATLISTEIARRRSTTPPPATNAAVVVTPEDDPSTRGIDLGHLAAAARGRHVIWIVLESTGARYLHPYGNPVDPMPTLTRLAGEGIVFEHAYAVYPESIKGLYAMLCSFSPAPNTSARSYDGASLPCRSIAERLHSDGYATSLFHSGRFGYLGMDHVVNNRGFDVLADAKTIGGKHASSFGTDDMSTVRAVLQRFDTARARGGSTDERLFVTYMPISGHHPYESPGEGARPFGEDSDFLRYESDLYRGDLALGALVDGLKARNLWNDTLLVIHGDHGEAFLQHEGNFAHTLYAYDENLHVPLVIVAPGIVSGGLRAKQLVSLVDIAPTIADLVGTAPDPAWQGISALRPEPRVIRSFADHTSVKLALRTGRHKLIVDTDTNRSELFDLVRDPGEQNDIARENANANAKRVATYRADLEHWSTSQRAAVVRTVAAVR